MKVTKLEKGKLIYRDCDREWMGTNLKFETIEGVQMSKIFVDGNDVYVVYDLKTKVVLSNVAEWFCVENDTITFIRVFLVARSFAAMFGQ